MAQVLFYIQVFNIVLYIVLFYIATDILSLILSVIEVC